MKFSSTLALLSIGVSGMTIAQELPQMPPSMFEVLPNETRVIERPDQLPDAIDYFVLRNNSTLLVKPEVGNWKLTARFGYFEPGAKIIASGHSHTQQAPNGTTGGNGGNCHTGKQAGNGTHGSNGGHGANVELHLGIASFGDLTIDTSGGAGQKGGNGGRGGAGGRADISEYCKGGSGGYGGNGGDGGIGGRAGNVTIEWWETGGSTPSLAGADGKLRGLRVVAKGGAAGAGGSRGEGGPGGPGRCKKIGFVKTCRGSGDTGGPGKPGRPSVKGQDGIVQVLRKER